eukprot:6184789-Amphidinium_carterae.1
MRASGENYMGYILHMTQPATVGDAAQMLRKRLHCHVNKIHITALGSEQPLMHTVLLAADSGPLAVRRNRDYRPGTTRRQRRSSFQPPTGERSRAAVLEAAELQYDQVFV